MTETVPVLVVGSGERVIPEPELIDVIPTWSPSSNPDGLLDISLQLTPSFTEAVTVGSDSEVIPTLSVSSAKPAGFPVMLDHEADVDDGVSQLTTPFASEVKTLPAPWLPSAIRTFPATSSFAAGLVVPIPTLP
ncbi:MAG: hypothetical protein Q8R04_00140 [Nanoarchaeota archaeon]|nr:hypothetical protein [Nanoarchaeota archaeon]